jgi:hypothetical protein
MAIVNLNVFCADDRAEELANLLCKSVRIGGLGKELEAAGFNIGTNYGTTIKRTHPDAEAPIRFSDKAVQGLCPPSVPQELQHLMPDGQEQLESLRRKGQL